jgi:hypothetical protein
MAERMDINGSLLISEKITKKGKNNTPKAASTCIDNPAIRPIKEAFSAVVLFKKINEG